MNVHKTSFQYGPHTVSIETGRLARQADGSVLVSMGDTVVLVTAVGRREAQPGKDFFPLTVNYIEKTYAAGRIPGGFFKREGRPSEKETLISRLIDRPMRAGFPEFFLKEVHAMAPVGLTMAVKWLLLKSLKSSVCWMPLVSMYISVTWSVTGRLTRTPEW